MELSAENNNIFKKLEKVVIYLSNEPLPQFFVMAPSMESPFYWTITCDFILLKLFLKAQSFNFDEHNSETFINALSQETELPPTAMPKIKWLINRCELIVNELFFMFVSELPELYFYDKKPAANEVFFAINFSEAKFSCRFSESISGIHLTRHQKKYILNVVEYRGFPIYDDEINWDAFVSNFLQMASYYKHAIREFLLVVFQKCRPYLQNENQDVKVLIQKFLYQKLDNSNLSFINSQEQWISPIHLSVLSSRISLFLRLRYLCQKYTLPPPINLRPWTKSPLFWSSTQDLFMVQVISQFGLTFSAIIVSSFATKVAEALEKIHLKNKATSTTYTPSDFLKACFELEIASYPKPISLSAIESYFHLGESEKQKFYSICPLKFLYDGNLRLQRLEEIINYYENIRGTLPPSQNQDGHSNANMIGNPMKYDFYFNRFDGPLLFDKKEAEKAKEMQSQIRSSKNNGVPDSTRPIIMDPFYNLFNFSGNNFQHIITTVISPDFMKTVENYPVGIDDSEFQRNPIDVKIINQLKPPKMVWPKNPRTLFLTPKELEQSIKVKSNIGKTTPPEVRTLSSSENGTPISNVEKETVHDQQSNNFINHMLKQYPSPISNNSISPPSAAISMAQPDPKSANPIPKSVIPPTQIIPPTSPIKQKSSLSPQHIAGVIPPMPGIPMMINNQIPLSQPNLIPGPIPNQMIPRTLPFPNAVIPPQSESPKTNKKHKKDKEEPPENDVEQTNEVGKKKRGRKPKPKDPEPTQDANNKHKKKGKKEAESSPTQTAANNPAINVSFQPAEIPKVNQPPAVSKSYSVINAAKETSNNRPSAIALKPPQSSKPQTAQPHPSKPPAAQPHPSKPQTAQPHPSKPPTPPAVTTTNRNMPQTVHETNKTTDTTKDANQSEIPIIIKGKIVASVPEKKIFKKSIEHNGRMFDFMFYATCQNPFTASSALNNPKPVFIIECASNDNVFDFVSSSFLDVFKLFKNGLKKLNEDGKDIYPPITVNSGFNFFSIPISIDIFDLVELLA